MKAFVRLYHLFFGFLAAGTLLFNLLNTDSIINFFSYFTILSNLMATSMFLYLGVRDGKNNFFVDTKRGAIVAYMLVTGVVYALLLEKLITMNAYPWVSFILHRIMPVAVVLSWIIYPPHNRLKFIDSFYWLSFPVLYLIYTLIRGPIANWYPYPFLDPNKFGYGGVFLNFIGISLVAWVASFIIILVGNYLYNKKYPHA